MSLRKPPSRSRESRHANRDRPGNRQKSRLFAENGVLHTPFFRFFITFAPDQKAHTMTNDQFREHLRQKLDALHKDDPGNMEQVSLLTSALKIMTYGTGPERRRFRRDYERRLAR